jgi:hypothetical protein
MKFEINFDTPKVQIGFSNTDNPVIAGIMELYFYSGERYEHDAYIPSNGNGELLIIVQNTAGYVGTIKVQAETPEEISLFSRDIAKSRNKETIYWTFINELNFKKVDYQYKRNQW